MQVMRENSTSTIVKIEETACAADIFVICDSTCYRASRVTATHFIDAKPRARTLSREIWQTKNFCHEGRSGAPAFRKSGFFGKHSPLIRGVVFSISGSPPVATGSFGRLIVTESSIAMNRARVPRYHFMKPIGRAATSVGGRTRRACRVVRSLSGYSPSLVLSSSLTDCGLALPPDDFIT